MSSSSTTIKTLKPLPVLAALGVVFGDIGTSPLYALKESLRLGGAATEDVLGVLSLIVWCLIGVVSIKYLSLISRVDNDGEGGILALLALLEDKKKEPKIKLGLTVGLLLFGAALLYGDGIITPAISIVGAIEGLEITFPSMTHFVVPISLIILFSLFSIQHKGTGHLGKLFGPIILVWFFVIGALGVYSIIRTPQVLQALNPLHGFIFFYHHGFHAFSVLGAIVLVVTGAEARYADLGHFGRKAIARAWHQIAFPGLLLNYLGQGAEVIRNPNSCDNPFFSLIPPGPFNVALVILATLAAIIASQALISGVFSLTHQAIQLGYFPRVEIIHTAEDSRGQIYIPVINWLLGVACAFMVLGFKSSANMASAYGIAVTATMTITSLAFGLVTHRHWKWPAWKSACVTACMLLMDIPLFTSNLPKVTDGGYIPLVLGAGILLVMHTWKVGRAMIASRLMDRELEIDYFLGEIRNRKPHRNEGTAIFMSGSYHRLPTTLLHHFKHNQVLHKNILLCTIVTDPIPKVKEKERLNLTELGEGLWRLVIHYGFMEEPQVVLAMRDAIKRSQGKLTFEPQHASYVFNREVIIPSKNSLLWLWQKELLVFLSQNARPARAYFNMPPNQIMELSTPIYL